ncbi:MAG TPA: hypothetical protein DDY88_06315 [Actinobacteria bacterium]|nr:hypothetical protein [Actinomycetota bacterium]
MAPPQTVRFGLLVVDPTVTFALLPHDGQEVTAMSQIDSPMHHGKCRKSITKRLAALIWLSDEQCGV